MADGVPRIIYQFSQPLRLRSDQMQDFVFWFSHHSLPEDSNLIMKKADEFWEISFICDFSDEMPFGASKALMIWVASYLGMLLVRYHVNANNAEYEARYQTS